MFSSFKYVFAVVGLVVVVVNCHDDIMNRMEEQYRWKQMGYDQLQDGTWSKIAHLK